MDDNNKTQNNETRPNQPEANTDQTGFNQAPSSLSEFPAVAPSNKSNTFAILGFIFAFLIPIVGLVLSIIGIKKAKELNGDKKGLAIAGLVISIISIIVSLLVGILIFVATVGSIQDQAKDIGKKIEANEKNENSAKKNQKSLKDGSSRTPFTFEKSYELKKVCESNARPSNAVASTDGSARTEVFSESDVAKGSFSSAPARFINKKFQVNFDNQNNVDYITCLSLQGSSDTDQSCDLQVKDQPVSIKLAKQTYNIDVYSAKTGDLVLSNKTVSTEESCPRFFTIIKNDRVYGSIDSGALELELEPLLQ